jgi:hypothetical protein
MILHLQYTVNSMPEQIILCLNTVLQIAAMNEKSPEENSSGL